MFPTIMIIDDESSILKSLGGLLADEGFEVITAGNGYEGLKLIEERSPDLVLLDIWMPDIDGISLLQEWAEAGELPCPVIMMTSVPGAAFCSS